MTTTKALLFDLDGTLLDTAPEFTACINQLLREEGKSPITETHLRSHVSHGAKGMIEFAFNLRATDPLFSSLKERFLALYAATLGTKTLLFPGIAELIATLTQHQLPWGIVTNKLESFTFPLLQQFPSLNSAALVIAGDTLPTQKPDPAQLLAACAHLKIAPEACWYIGDAKTDVEASKSAGLRCAIAQYGYIPLHEDPLNWKADRYINSGSEIMDLIIR